MGFVTVNGVRLFYEEAGGGRPLVLLHGWGTSGRVWGAQVPDLARDHHVITLDWRGCGRSERPATGNTISGVVRDILGFIDALDLPAPVLVGSSIAGAFVIEAAHTEPDRIGGIVPVGAGVHYFSQGKDEQMSGLLAGLRTDRAGTLAAIVPNWFRPGTGAALHDWTVHQILDSGVFIDELISDQAHYDPRPYLGELRVPVTFLHGALDAEIPREIPEECAALIPGAEAVFIDGAGHMAQQDRPDDFTRALRAAVRRMSTPADVSRASA
ncbi:alpha/beta fold hydrolase [Actinomadura nitritigenes]|uniref:alpha/beta fold hydrolase n=1 Tax=Actinomadura nitritigenes TaxID=134602 RepID=UPI003D9298DE